MLGLLLRPKKLIKLIISIILIIAIGFGIAYFREPIMNKYHEWVGNTTPSTDESISNIPPISIGNFNYDEIPEYSGIPYIILNENTPYFTEEEIAKWTSYAFEDYGELDALGRCTVCVSNIGQELMPEDARESISSIKPTGWVPQTKSPAVYNRCHLIGFQLTGENANKQNLITGTRALNVDAMLPYENLVADYIKDTGNHVLYRVTPIFIDDELVCRGLIMEGYSVEDNGAVISYCIWCYNNQDNITIDYATGEYVYNE